MRHFEAACPAVRGKSFILFLGRLHEKKGCDLLIEAFAQSASSYPETHLVMAGPGDRGYQAMLGSLAARSGVGARVHFPGMLQGDAKWGAFYAAEVFSLPSHQENFGVAVAEALACGTPVLISNKVNIWREIADEEAGFVDEDTVDGASRLLRQWRETPPDRRLAMAAKCRSTFERRFDIARLPQVIANLFPTKTGSR
jgi:glycosyltransferase involved in cell wall biosynthesis